MNQWPPTYATDNGPLFDVCANRHQGNQESIAANPSHGSKRQAHETILAMLRERNMTAKEIAAAMGRPLHAVSGRCAEMKALHLIRATGERREGSAVLEVSVEA